MKIRLIRLPVSLKDNAILDLLASFQFVFKLNGNKRPNVKIQGARVRKVSLLAQLLLYKFIGYSQENKKFTHPRFELSNYLLKELELSGFRPLIEWHMKSGSSLMAKAGKFPVKTQMVKGFFIAPLHLHRDDMERTLHEERFIKSLNVFYDYDPKIISLTSTCMSEIFMNFWEHATKDTGTIMVAKGSKQELNIMFADTGNGIISTLRNKPEENGHYILERSIEKGTTSKLRTNHMGWGLWLVKELCLLNKGRLTIYSEGFCLTCLGGDIKIKECAYWKGTIIQLVLPLSQPLAISDIKTLKNVESKLKIKWV